MVCLNYFFEIQIRLEKHFKNSAVLGICGPRKKKTALRGIALPSRERVQGLPIV